MLSPTAKVATATTNQLSVDRLRAIYNITSYIYLYFSAMQSNSNGNSAKRNAPNALRACRYREKPLTTAPSENTQIRACASVC